MAKRNLVIFFHHFSSTQNTNHQECKKWNRFLLWIKGGRVVIFHIFYESQNLVHCDLLAKCVVVGICFISIPLITRHFNHFYLFGAKLGLFSVLLNFRWKFGFKIIDINASARQRRKRWLNKTNTIRYKFSIVTMDTLNIEYL